MLTYTTRINLKIIILSEENRVEDYILFHYFIFMKLLEKKENI